MTGFTIGSTNQDAMRRLRESPCRTEATLMTFTLEGEGCAPQAAGKPQSMDANRNPDTIPIFLECPIVSTDDTATTAATGERRLRHVAVFWRLSAKPQLTYTLTTVLGVSGA